MSSHINSGIPSLGMTKEELATVLGEPIGVSYDGHGLEVLRYHIRIGDNPAPAGAVEICVVSILNGRVVSYGRMCEGGRSGER